MRHDLKLLAADKILWIVAALLLFLVAGGIYNGAAWANERKNSVAELERKGFDELNKQRAEASELETGAKAMPSLIPPALLPTGKSVPVVLPPAPLAALSVGQSDIYPYATSVNLMTEKNDLFQEYEQDNPLALLTGKFDLAFVLVFVFPLLILAVSYNLLSAERENGTLALTMANAAVSARKIVAGKFLTRLLLILACAAGFSLVGLLLSGVNLFASENLPRIGLFVAAITLYALFWFAAAITVNSFGFSSATNAIVLGGVWVLIAVIVPSFLNVAATTIHPVPSRLEFVSKMREADNQTRSEGEKLLKSYYGDHPELAPPDGLTQSQASQRFYAIRQERQKRLMPEVEQFERQLAAQNALVANYRVLSPAVVMLETLNDIAGTSVQRQKSYVRQIREHVDDLQNFLVPKLMRRETLRAANYDQIPRFQFREETNAEIRRRGGVGFLLLLIPTGLLGTYAFWRLSRFSPLK
jgi:ABC-2 type transport system permease protein